MCVKPHPMLLALLRIIELKLGVRDTFWQIIHLLKNSSFDQPKQFMNST